MCAQKRIQSLYLHFLHHYNYKIKYLNDIRGLDFRKIRANHVGLHPSSETANIYTPCKTQWREEAFYARKKFPFKRNDLPCCEDANTFR